MSTLSKNPTELLAIIDQLEDLPEPTDIGPPNGWPKKIWIVKFGETKYGMLRVPYKRKGQTSIKVAGLACFTHKKSIERYMHLLQTDVNTARQVMEVSYKRGVEIVMELTTPKALHLADNIDAPDTVILKDLS